MDVNLVSPEGVRFKGQAKSLSLPAWDGQVGVLPGHAPMIGLLGSGEVRIDVKGGPVESFFLAGGVFMIAGVGVTLLTENCGKEPFSSGLVDIDEMRERMEDSGVSERSV
jgi:F-type H+-transporting ATPase subunit epsilon|tara:strand:+ start:1004 stop:1333 length:330 start_codon:yes stop_codon:yes gene_type:complete